MSEITAQIAQYVEDIDNVQDELGGFVRRKINVMGQLDTRNAELAAVVTAAQGAADEAIFEAEMAGKDGPLGSMAKTSGGYKAGVRILEEKAQGQLAGEVAKLKTAIAELVTEERTTDETIKTLHYILRARGSQLSALTTILPHEEPDTDRTSHECDCPF